jgi:hypothetical protein
VKAPERKERCEGCGASLGEPSIVDHHVVEEIMNPHPRQVIDFLEFEWMCTECGSHTVSRHPDCPPGGRLGKNVLVQATLMKFQERLPHWKVCEALERTYGLQVTPATVLDMTRQVGGWLRPEYMRILQRIRSAEMVYVDETGARVDGVRHWTWAFTTRSETLVAIRRSRGKKVLKEVLGRASGAWWSATVGGATRTSRGAYRGAGPTSSGRRRVSRSTWRRLGPSRRSCMGCTGASTCRRWTGLHRMRRRGWRRRRGP